MVYTHRDHDHEDGTQAWAQPSNDQITVHAAEYAQPLFHNGFQQPLNAYDQSLHQTVQAYQHHTLTTALSSQQQSSALGTFQTEFASAYPQMVQMYAPNSNNDTSVPVETNLHDQHDLERSQLSTNSAIMPPTHPSFSHTSNSAHSLHHYHHHHHLQRRHTLSEFDQTYHGSGLYSAEKHFPSSVVGDLDMPEPAARPTGPKLKFTPADDALLVDLKETKDLTWKQIVDFFPGRSSGTLQVRYCTKLKAKEMIWTEFLLERLRQALEEYERDRWQIISGKVGNGFSATACKDKFKELTDGMGQTRYFDTT